MDGTHSLIRVIQLTYLSEPKEQALEDVKRLLEDFLIGVRTTFSPREIAEMLYDFKDHPDFQGKAEVLLGVR